MQYKDDFGKVLLDDDSGITLSRNCGSHNAKSISDKIVAGYRLQEQLTAHGVLVAVLQVHYPGLA